MAAAFQGYHLPAIASRSAPLARAGIAAGVGKAFLVGIPAILIGLGVGYGLSRAFDTRWDEFSKRAADGDPTMGQPRQLPR